MEKIIRYYDEKKDCYFYEKNKALLDYYRSLGDILSPAQIKRNYDKLVLKEQMTVGLLMWYAHRPNKDSWFYGVSWQYDQTSSKRFQSCRRHLLLARAGLIEIKRDETRSHELSYKVKVTELGKEAAEEIINLH